jgi:hypothetical protein
LIEEMISDTMDDDELDEAADEEVDKVLEEITLGLKTTTTPRHELPVEEKEEDLEARLGALKA